MRKLFVEELKTVQGGKAVEVLVPRCKNTTMACCEEAPPCTTCCDVA
ncbi:MAG TPA: hypothetical protein VJ826_03560 [Candidatus Polarisedimenticolaceae bacterium]|nr:hypothetical protein [Candidatus Polarisedimenticolaceae bacterium]